MKRRPRYEVMHQPWKQVAWAVICNFGVVGWDYVSHHHTEASAQRKVAKLLAAEEPNHG